MAAEPPDKAGFGGSPAAAERAVAFLKSLSHRGRLQILCLLLEQDMSVGDLALAIGMSQPLASQQLMRLRAEGHVGARRQGKAVIYHLLRPEVRPVIAALRDTFCALPHPSG
jgi:DNA-binding transcriptional ArsR family regulator